MTEKQYRLRRLEDIGYTLKNQRIALYGTGRNAEAIISTLTDINIICVIDEKTVGQYVWGKKVITMEEALYLDLNVIILAAEAQAEMQISERISKICRLNNITILNMYGVDIFSMKKNDIEQEIAYNDLTENTVLSAIENHDVACFELMGVLCESRYYSKEYMWKTIEQDNSIPQFFKNRLLAEKEKSVYCPYSINEIYDRYLVNTFSDRREISGLINIEENTFQESIVPKKDVVNILNRTCEMGKKVFIISELPYSNHTVKEVLVKIGIKSGVQLVQENIENKTVSMGMIRMSMGEYFGKKTIYFGRKNSISYYIAKSYGMNTCMIKNSCEMMSIYSEICMPEDDFEEEKRQIYKEWAVKKYNSPFKAEEEIIIDEMGDWLGKENSDEEKTLLELIEFINSDQKNDFEPLEFSPVDKIEVSIVIPVYNHFDYTYACLKSILENTRKVQYEIIVADDCSSDLTKEIDDIVKGITIVRNSENLLFLKNCNNAAQYAKGKYILFLNNDTQVRYNWLYPLVEIMEKDSTIGMTGSKLLCPDGTVQEAGGIIFNDGSAMNYGRGRNPKLPELNYVRDVDYISGASIMIRSELWKEIGGFDEEFAPAYCEDSDLAFEVRKRGKRVVYQPASEVIHFEGVSNGTDVSKGVKRYQVENSHKLARKWHDELRNQYRNTREDLFAAKDRKQSKKTVLVISWCVPTYDRDAGSKSITDYVKLFLEKGYLVKFWPVNMYPVQPYILEMQQMGVEVLYGKELKKNIQNWVFNHQKDIEYAFVNYPLAASEVMDLLRMTSIKIRYYGHDLHYLRLRREYDVNHEETSLEESKLYYEKEKRIIKNSEIVYYPSEVEIGIVKGEFGKMEAKQISLYMYGKHDLYGYHPETREGIMFIGGAHGPNEDAVIWFLNEIYPSIYAKKKIPFCLVGANHSSKLNDINVEGVINTGYVTDEELVNLYHKVRMVVIPLRYGAGIKGKVVDAMYHGVPIVSTSVGIEGIPDAENCCSIADGAEDFALKVEILYDNYGELMEMSKKSKCVIEKEFSIEAAWEKVKSDF